jgi:hypothetical protein
MEARMFMNFILLILYYILRFHVLTAASMKMRALWGIEPCSLGVGRRFRCAYCLLHQGDECSHPSSWWWKYVPLERRSTPTRLHGAISQKALIFCSIFITFQQRTQLLLLLLSADDAVCRVLWEFILSRTESLVKFDVVYSGSLSSYMWTRSVRLCCLWSLSRYHSLPVSACANTQYRGFFCPAIFLPLCD